MAMFNPYTANCSIKEIRKNECDFGVSKDYCIPEGQPVWRVGPKCCRDLSPYLHCEEVNPEFSFISVINPFSKNSQHHCLGQSVCTKSQDIPPNYFLYSFSFYSGPTTNL